jgi:hypothetical protein
MKAVKIQKARRLKLICDSQTHGLGGPKKTAVCFYFYSVWLAGALAGRSHRRTTGRD